MSQTYDYVSERRLLYFTQKLKQHFPDAANLIDDTTSTATDKTWSAKKIYEEVAKAAGLEFVKVDTLPAVGQNNKIYLLPIRTITVSTTIAGTDITVDKTTFVSMLSANGTYVFTFDGTNWTYDGNPVNLVDYGISYDVAATPAASDTITVTLTTASNPNVFEEYIWFTDTSVDPEVSYYELIGTTEVDLSGYVKDEEMVEITTAEIDAIIATVWPT